MITVRSYISIILLLAGISCGEARLPKPKSFLVLDYPEQSYLKMNTNCPYEFEMSDDALLETRSNCWTTLSYPKLRARIHITYRSVDNNLEEILREVEKLTFDHTIKADAIEAPKLFEHPEERVFAQIYRIEGDVATNIQFSATDSLNHVLAGALYFHANPNYDSVVPAINHLEKDIIHLIESLKWK